MRTFTEEQFNELIGEIIPSALFHISPTDVDDKTGAKLEEIILLEVLGKFPEALKYKSLSWFVDYFITKANKLYIYTEPNPYHVVDSHTHILIESSINKAFATLGENMFYNNKLPEDDKQYVKEFDLEIGYKK